MKHLESFKIQDAGSYDELAGSFDRHTQIYSTYAVDALLAKIPASAIGTLLDIGCGTGIVALAAARRFPDAQIVGVDLSDGMLAFARTAAAREGLSSRVDFLQSDAEALDLADGSMAAAVSLYAWRHLPDPARATAEVFRVLQPGGRFIVAVGSRPALASGAGVRTALSLPFRKVAQARGRELAACDHLDRLVARILPPATALEEAEWTGGHHSFSGSLGNLLERAGFKLERSSWVGRRYELSSVEDFWDLQATFSSTARKRIAASRQKDVAALRAAFEQECAHTLSHGGKLVYQVGAAIVSAVKP